MQFLKPNAQGYIVKQISLADKLKVWMVFTRLTAAEESYKLQITVVNVSVKLPCQHIFALCSSCKAALYSLELCATWWTLAYYHTNHQVIAGDSCYEDSDLNVSSSHVNVSPVFSQHEKYPRTFFVAQKLSIIVYEPLMREFDAKLEVLENLLAMWQQEMKLFLPVLVKKILIH